MSDMELGEAYKFFRSHITGAVEKCLRTRKPHRKKNLYELESISGDEEKEVSLGHLLLNRKPAGLCAIH